MLFEAFVTGQRKTADTRHVEDARVAIAAFQRGMREPASLQSSVEEPICLSLLGAVMLRTGWALTRPSYLSLPRRSSACVKASRLVDAAFKRCDFRMTESREVSERKLRGREEIQRLMMEFESSQAVGCLKPRLSVHRTQSSIRYSGSARGGSPFFCKPLSRALTL